MENYFTICYNTNWGVGGGFWALFKDSASNWNYSIAKNDWVLSLRKCVYMACLRTHSHLGDWEKRDFLIHNAQSLSQKYFQLCGRPTGAFP